MYSINKCSVSLLTPFFEITCVENEITYNISGLGAEKCIQSVMQPHMAGPRIKRIIVDGLW